MPSLATLTGMNADPARRIPLPAYSQHSREWERNRYVYPVISRRSHGLSIGVNLNPDTACNFDCIYCQVDRSQPPKVRDVDLELLRTELDAMIGWAVDGSLFDHPRFADVPAELRRINDIAFSGDGEPTTCPVFAESVALAAQLKAKHNLHDAKIILITDACYLTRPNVLRGLLIMDDNNGEIWAKLDAGTEAYYQLVNRPNYPLAHVMTNITSAATVRPVCIQSLFMRVEGQPPDSAEIEAFIDRLKEIVDAGGKIKQVQVYTVARQPAESYVTPLPDNELDAIAHRVRKRTGLRTETYYGSQVSTDT